MSSSDPGGELESELDAAADTVPPRRMSGA